MQCVINAIIVNDDDELSPDLTLLRYLRENKKLCGTKEGCASGDCGACTVMIGSLAPKSPSNDQIIEYKTVNSCIAPANAFEGKHIVTVEHLSRDKFLHPAQAAMVENHGSQCGFCTPGFVISLACMYENDKVHIGANPPKKIDVCEAISGNLCRCTGYRPIINAGMSLGEYRESNALYNQNTFNYLKNLSLNNHGKYFSPASLTELNTLMTENPSAKLIAGGTDLMLEVTQAYHHFECLIDLSNVAEMNIFNIPSTSEIAEENNPVSENSSKNEHDFITVGAAVTYSELEQNLKVCFPEFSVFLQRFASRQIRNRATIGGNIANASPIADTPPVLLSLDAILNIGSNTGEQRRQRLDDFYLDYKNTSLKSNEYIISIAFPKRYLNHFFRFYKVSKRIEDDISSVMLAVRMEIYDSKIIDTRLAFGGMAATPIRAKACETQLTNIPLGEESHLKVAKELISQQLTPLSDVRASSEYRLKVARNLLVKVWHEANGKNFPNLGKMESTTYA